MTAVDCGRGSVRQDGTMIPDSELLDAGPVAEHVLRRLAHLVLSLAEALRAHCLERLARASAAGARFERLALALSGWWHFEQLVELAPRGITVNCLAPGVIVTDMLVETMRMGADQAEGLIDNAIKDVGAKLH